MMTLTRWPFALCSSYELCASKHFVLKQRRSVGLLTILNKISVQQEFLSYKLKRLFFNSIFVRYIPWNIHEPEPGVYNFEGEADVLSFIKLVQETGLLLILRPGWTIFIKHIKILSFDCEGRRS